MTTTSTLRNPWRQAVVRATFATAGLVAMTVLVQAVLVGADRMAGSGPHHGFMEELGDRLWFAMFWWAQLPAYFLTVLLTARQARRTAARWGFAFLSAGVYLASGVVAIVVYAGPEGATAVGLMLWLSLLVIFDTEFALIAAAVALLAARYDKRVRYR